MMAWWRQHSSFAEVRIQLRLWSMTRKIEYDMYSLDLRVFSTFFDNGWHEKSAPTGQQYRAHSELLRYDTYAYIVE